MELFINRILGLSQPNDYQTYDSSFFFSSFTSQFIVVGLNSRDTQNEKLV